MREAHNAGDTFSKTGSPARPSTTLTSGSESPRSAALATGLNLTDPVDADDRPGAAAARGDAVEHGHATLVAHRAGTVAPGGEVNSLVLREHDLEDRTPRDPLTGYPNRAAFTDRLSLEVAYSRRTDTNVAVLLADVDDYHTVADAHGRAAGDQLLVEIGGRLAASVRQGDTVARTGESEFGIICPDLAGMQPAVAIAERLCAAAAKPMTIGDHVQSATISVGVECAEGEHDSATLLQHANQALFDHKQLRRVLQWDRQR